MCMKTNKILFTNQSGMQALIFLMATNFDKVNHSFHIKTYNVLNGNGNGTSIGTFIKSWDALKELKPNDILIDNVTGDIFSLNAETEKLLLKGNVGLHYHKAA